MDIPTDPNIPDVSNGDFFCHLCLARMNSEQMWSSHIVGKRHIKNVSSFSNGLTKRKKFFDDEDSYERPPKMERYDSMDDYPPPPLPPPPMYQDDYYYEDDYYKRRPINYVPEVRPVVVHDYGHMKVEDPVSKLEPKKPEEEFLEAAKNIDIDSIINEVKKSAAKENSCKVKEEPKKDDFFEKLNAKFLAEDLADELVKRRVQEKKDDILKAKAAELLKERKIDELKKEKKDTGASPDILEILHKQNDDRLFKKIATDEKLSSSSKSSLTSSPSKKLPIRLDKIDPDKLTPDMMDDILSSYLKPKIDSMVKNSVTTLDKEPKKKEVNLDDPDVLGKKFMDLPTKTFLPLAVEKLKSIDLKDSEELQMIFKVICQAQEIICKKLPPHLQAIVKAKMSGNYSKNTETKAQSVPVSQQPTVTSVFPQMLTTNVSHTSTAPSTSSQFQNALKTTVVPSPAVQIHNPSIIQAGPVPPVSLPAQSTPALQNLPSISIPPPSVPSTFQSPESTTTLPVGAIRPGIPIPPPSLPPMFQLPGSTTALPMGAMPPNLNLLMYQAQIASGRFPGVSEVRPNSVGYPTAWQNMTNMNYYQMMYSMYRNRLPVPPAVTSISQPQKPGGLPSTTSASNPQSSQVTVAALASLKTLAEEYASKKKNSKETRSEPIEQSKKKTSREKIWEDEELSRKEFSRKESSREDSKGSFRRESRENSKDSDRKEYREKSKDYDRKECRENSEDSDRKESVEQSRKKTEGVYKKDCKWDSRWN